MAAVAPADDVLKGNDLILLRVKSTVVLRNAVSCRYLPTRRDEGTGLGYYDDVDDNATEAAGREQTVPKIVDMFKDNLKFYF